MISANTFKPKSQAINAQSYADLMPLNKKLWVMFQKSDTISRALLLAFSKELARFQDLEFQIANTYIPNFDNSMIERWEKLLGIPDDCFLNSESDEIRRRNIIIKLAFMNLQTTQDYIDLATILGLQITISYADQDIRFPYQFPITFLTTKEAKNTWYINVTENGEPAADAFPFTFPITFGVSNSTLFECICQKQKPAQTRLVFTFIAEDVVYVDNSGNIYIDQSHDVYIQ